MQFVHILLLSDLQACFSTVNEIIPNCIIAMAMECGLSPALHGSASLSPCDLSSAIGYKIIFVLAIWPVTGLISKINCPPYS